MRIVTQKPVIYQLQKASEARPYVEQQVQLRSKDYSEESN